MGLKVVGGGLADISVLNFLRGFLANKLVVSFFVLREEVRATGISGDLSPLPSLRYVNSADNPIINSKGIGDLRTPLWRNSPHTTGGVIQTRGIKRMEIVGVDAEKYLILVLIM